MHQELATEFLEELNTFGEYMYRFMPEYEIKSRHIEDPKSKQAAAMEMMLSNSTDFAVAQHPQELITYGETDPCFKTG